MKGKYFYHYTLYILQGSEQKVAGQGSGVTSLDLKEMDEDADKSAFRSLTRDLRAQAGIDKDVFLDIDFISKL